MSSDCGRSSKQLMHQSAKSNTVLPPDHTDIPRARSRDVIKKVETSIECFCFLEWVCFPLDKNSFCQKNQKC
eukprot:6107389-Amphidinium_carterae.1